MSTNTSKNRVILPPYSNDDTCSLCGKYLRFHKMTFDHVFQSIKLRDAKEENLGITWTDYNKG